MDRKRLIMKNKILWICPSRNRPDRLERFLKSWRECGEGLSDVLVALDTDDKTNDRLIKEFPEVIWEINDPIFGSFLHLVNSMAVKYVDDYKYLGFIEDDVVFHTPGYESRFIKKLESLGPTGIVHAKDGIDKKKFVSLPVMNSHIVKTLGWMAPPCLKSLWADNFWRSLSTRVQTYYKFEDIMIKHHHYTRDADTEKDEVSVIVDNNYNHDRDAFVAYLENGFDADMRKLGK